MTEPAPYEGPVAFPPSDATVEEQWGVRWEEDRVEDRVWGYTNKAEAERGIERQATVGMVGTLVRRTVTTTGWTEVVTPRQSDDPAQSAPS